MTVARQDLARGCVGWAAGALSLGCLLTLGSAAAVGAQDWGREPPPERHGLVSARIVVGGWGITRNYLGSDGYFVVGMGWEGFHEVVLGRSGNRGRLALIDLGIALRGLYGNPGPVFTVQGEVELGLRFELVGFGAFASVEAFLFNVPGQQRTWAGLFAGPQLYLRGFGRPDGEAGALAFRWSAPVDPFGVCGLENLEIRGFYSSGVVSFGAGARWCAEFGPYTDSIEASADVRFIFD